MKRTGLSSALAPLVLSLPSFVRSQTVIYPPEGLTVNDGDSMNVVFDTPYSAVNLTVFCLEDTTQDYAFHAYDGNPLPASGTAYLAPIDESIGLNWQASTIYACHMLFQDPETTSNLFNSGHFNMISTDGVATTWSAAVSATGFSSSAVASATSSAASSQQSTSVTSSQPSQKMPSSTRSTNTLLPASTSPSATSSSSSLSAGASAGIGVGVALGVLLLALIAFIFYRRRRRAAKQQQQASSFENARPDPYNNDNNQKGYRESKNTYGAGGYSDHPGGTNTRTGPVEVGGHEVASEMPGNEGRYELQ